MMISKKQKLIKINNPIKVALYCSGSQFSIEIFVKQLPLNLPLLPSIRSDIRRSVGGGKW